MAPQESLRVAKALVRDSNVSIRSKKSWERLVQYGRLTYLSYVLPAPYRHSQFRDCLSISCRFLERAFGRRGFQEINRKFGWLSMHQCEGKAIYFFEGASRRGYTKAYRLTSKGEEAIVSVLKDTRRYRERARSNGSALLSRDSRGAPARKRFHLPKLIEIVKPDWDKESDSLAARQLLALGWFAYQEKGISQLEHQYRQSTAGRWYTHGHGLSLQNCLKGVRNQLLRGCYDYDLQCCHFALLRELTKGSSFKMPVIESMLLDREDFRRSLESSIGLSAGSSKILLNSLAYGARLSANRHCALSIVFSRRDIQAIEKNREVRFLRRELRSAKSLLIEGASRNSVKGRLTNRLGKSVLKRESSHDQKIAHLLQGAEALVLATVGAVYGSRMKLLVHDGWVLKDYVPPEEIEGLVREELGWHLRVDCNRL